MVNFMLCIFYNLKIKKKKKILSPVLELNLTAGNLSKGNLPTGGSGDMSQHN